MAKVSIKNGVFMHNGIGIAHGPNDELNLEDVHFEGNRIAGIMEQRGLSPERLLPFFELLAKHSGPVASTDVERAAEKTGLSQHLKEHGWEIGSFALSVSQVISQHPDWPSKMLSWTHGWI